MLMELPGSRIDNQESQGGASSAGIWDIELKIDTEQGSELTPYGPDVFYIDEYLAVKKCHLWMYLSGSLPVAKNSST